MDDKEKLAEALDLLNQRITYLEGPEFQAWKREQIDPRATLALSQAIEAAKQMTPEGCFKAAHCLLLYASFVEMTDGVILDARVTREMLQ